MEDVCQTLPPSDDDDDDDDDETGWTKREVLIKCQDGYRDRQQSTYNTDNTWSTSTKSNKKADLVEPFPIFIERNCLLQLSKKNKKKKKLHST